MGSPHDTTGQVSGQLDAIFKQVLPRFPNTVLFAVTVPPAGQADDPADSTLEGVWCAHHGSVRPGEAARMAAMLNRHLRAWFERYAAYAGVDQDALADEAMRLVAEDIAINSIEGPDEGGCGSGQAEPDPG